MRWLGSRHPNPDALMVRGGVAGSVRVGVQLISGTRLSAARRIMRPRTAAFGWARRHRASPRGSARWSRGQLANGVEHASRPCWSERVLEDRCRVHVRPSSASAAMLRAASGRHSATVRRPFSPGGSGTRPPCRQRPLPGRRGSVVPNPARSSSAGQDARRRSTMTITPSSTRGMSRSRTRRLARPVSWSASLRFAAHSRDHTCIRRSR